MDKNQMMHYGVPGMKWGRRKGPTQTTDIKSVKRKLDATNEGVKSAKNINEQFRAPKESKQKAENASNIRKEVYKMSDTELRDKVNRLNMEERYTQVMESRYTSTGKDTVGKILSVASTALAVGSSAASIALAMKELRK